VQIGGNLYGTTYSGGANDKGGTVFQITTSGTLTTLYSFCAKSNCADGESPLGELVADSNGVLYGTTRDGGLNVGTVFRITQSAKLTTLHSFCSVANCADGQQTYAGLVLASDGNFCGTTPFGGNNSGGARSSKSLPAAI
jgi:uncharacterized repeat protein (TIGR03803 family)